MVDLESLALRAQSSIDHESYVAVAKARGYRIGAGARALPGDEPRFFVEVVLDPLPDRPEVDPARLVGQAALLQTLQRRGYALACDDAGVVTCDRTLGRAAASREIRELPELLLSVPRKNRRA